MLPSPWVPNSDLLRSPLRRPVGRAGLVPGVLVVPEIVARVLQALVRLGGEVRQVGQVLGRVAHRLVVQRELDHGRVGRADANPEHLLAGAELAVGGEHLFIAVAVDLRLPVLLGDVQAGAADVAVVVAVDEGSHLAEAGVRRVLELGLIGDDEQPAAAVGLLGDAEAVAVDQPFGAGFAVGGELVEAGQLDGDVEEIGVEAGTGLDDVKVLEVLGGREALAAVRPACGPGRSGRSAVRRGRSGSCRRRGRWSSSAGRSPR